jgi:hypothetical protein
LKDYGFLDGAMKAIIYFGGLHAIVFGTKAEEIRDVGVLKSFMANKKKAKSKTDQTNFNDRQGGSIADGYSKDQFRKMSNNWLDLSVDKESTFENMRARSITLLSHSSVGRGNSVRNLQLCDFFSLFLDGIKPSPGYMMGYLDLNGKTNAVSVDVLWF